MKLLDIFEIYKIFIPKEIKDNILISDLSEKRITMIKTSIDLKNQ